MLACDVLLEVRSSWRLSREQVARIEKSAFEDGLLRVEATQLIDLIRGYVLRADPSWFDLLARVDAARPSVQATALAA